MIKTEVVKVRKSTPKDLPLYIGNLVVSTEDGSFLYRIPGKVKRFSRKDALRDAEIHKTDLELQNDICTQ